MQKSRGIEPGADLARIREYLRGEHHTVAEIQSWIESILERRYPVLRSQREDLCQTVHVRLVESLQAGRFGFRASLRTYVSVITHHVAIDRLRRQYPEKPLPLEGPSLPQLIDESDPYHELETAEHSRLLHRALRLSSGACRQLWKLVFQDRLSYREIGELLGIPPGTVKSRMWQCRRKAMLLLRNLERGADPRDD